ncbi:uncharacterized protein LOC130962732 [Arachis stenosperma]|uniref:uncharacterized protein LOC130962732 n=1 Tax=Arachis stenosperma TaxID=217475 RepID=UPI0025AD0772|nr:uncharacterized protein LOC130962732 [Arachis stenosperma]
MYQRRYCAKAMSLPGSNALYGSRTMSNEQEPLQWCSEKVKNRNGLGIIVDKQWKKDIVDVKRVDDWIISTKLVVEAVTFRVISAYAPQVSSDEQHKIRFWEDLESLVQDIPL